MGQFHAWFNSIEVSGVHARMNWVLVENRATAASVGREVDTDGMRLDRVKAA